MLRRLVPLLLATVVLAGCSSKDNDPKGKPATATSNPANTPTADTTLCRLLTAADFIAKGSARIGPENHQKNRRHGNLQLR